MSEDEDPPPFFARWKSLYVLMIAELAALVLAFYLLARWAS